MGLTKYVENVTSIQVSWEMPENNVIRHHDHKSSVL